MSGCRAVSRIGGYFVAFVEVLKCFCGKSSRETTKKPKYSGGGGSGTVSFQEFGFLTPPISTRVQK
jgi:hypothetical protein